MIAPGKAQPKLAATHTDVHHPHEINSDNKFCCAKMYALGTFSNVDVVKISTTASTAITASIQVSIVVMIGGHISDLSRLTILLAASILGLVYVQIAAGIRIFGSCSRPD